MLTQIELAILVEPHHIKKGFEGIKRLFFNSQKPKLNWC